MLYFLEGSGSYEPNLGQLRTKVDSLGGRLPDEYCDFVIQNRIGKFREKSQFLLDRYLRPTPTGFWKSVLQGYEYGYNWLNSPNQIMHDLENYGEAIDELNSSGLLRIGDTGSPGGIFLGVKGENFGSYFIYEWDHKERPVKACKSMDELSSLYQYEPRDTYLNLERPVDQRYLLLDDSEKVIHGIIMENQEGLSSKKGYIRVEDFIANLKRLRDDV